MSRVGQSSFILLVIGLSACVDAPAAPKARNLGVSFDAVNVQCSPVQFHVHHVPTGPFEIVGVTTGDIERSLITVFDPGSPEFHGVTLHNSGTAQWTLTRAPAGIPLSFATTFDNMNHFVDRPGSPATVIENIGTHRALSGISRANLEYTGTFTFLPTPVAEHDFHGVLCP